MSVTAIPMSDASTKSATISVHDFPCAFEHFVPAHTGAGHSCFNRTRKVRVEVPPIRRDAGNYSASLFVKGYFIRQVARRGLREHLHVG